MYVSIYNLEYRYVIVYRDYFIQVYYLDIFGLFDMHHKLVMDCTAVVRGETRCSSISTCCHRTRLTDIGTRCFVKIGDCTGDLPWEVSVSKSTKWVVLCLGESVLVKDRFVRDRAFWDFCNIVSGGLSPICRFHNEPKALETKGRVELSRFTSTTIWGFSSSWCANLGKCQAGNPLTIRTWMKCPWKCPRVGDVSQRISLEVTFFWACPKKIC